MAPSFQELLSDYISNYGFPPEVAIFLDNQAALKSITLPTRKSPGKNLTIKIFNKFQTWSPCMLINLYCCPGNIRIQQNKEVDKLAKEEANSMTPSHHTLDCTSISRLKQIKNQCAKTPPIFSEIETLWVKFKTPPKPIIQALDQLEKALQPPSINYAPKMFP
ncbi:hypothetical protein O181_018168 [Austropuccinia psidii MF-1]|uniref:Uncharacterized protein n=1 Tax=Austropuccinia psidii MF-1 TaxID=1389203 RepID=A0A9Q3C8J6_9BASI|nr:hypothetical protein [Austropuccinia psidii MF-1]